MRRHLLDHPDLVDILRLAYRHGYAGGIGRALWDEDLPSNLDVAIQEASFDFSIGRVIDGEEPEVPVILGGYEVR